MSDRTLPPHPDLEQYRKQAKDLLHALKQRTPAALNRAEAAHPQFNSKTAMLWKLADAQLVLAREHGFASWPQFSAHITTLTIRQKLEGIADPVAAFLIAASVPREGNHASGTVEEAEAILARYPGLKRASIYTAAVLADEQGVKQFLQRDPLAASAPGGVYNWDALTYLCFSRYLRLDKGRSEAFVKTARALLEGGAKANTGWYETIDHPNPRQIIESAIYGAAGIAQHAELTRVLLEFGADPNDEETPYHAAESYDAAVLGALLDSGKLNAESLTTLLLRKADVHDTDGMRILLEHGADPNAMTRWGQTALHQALRRDNHIDAIRLLLDHGADPALTNLHTLQSGIVIAARRGRADVLNLLTERGVAHALHGLDSAIATCALAKHDEARRLIASDSRLLSELLEQGGTLLAEFAGNGSTEGVRCLLDIGVPADAVHAQGDGYWDVARNSTALHVAAWRARPQTVKLLIARGAPVDATDGKGRTALALAVRACVDSYWTGRRTPESVQALLDAGATIDGITIPCGYDAVDELLSARAGQRNV